MSQTHVPINRPVRGARSFLPYAPPIGTQKQIDAAANAFFARKGLHIGSRRLTQKQKEKLLRSAGGSPAVLRPGVTTGLGSRRSRRNGGAA
jgi:hypothetical protein